MKSLGIFGSYGGCYVSELLIPALEEVETAFLRYKDDPDFQSELEALLRDFAGRPTPLTELRNLTVGTQYRIVLKREDLLHGGAHKTNNVLGQALLARRMGKKEIIAETGAGQHGAAAAMAGALLKIPVKIFMGEKDVERQAPNVERMKLFGAEVIAVESGSASLKDAINEALRYWTARSTDSYYLFGTVAGPHPFPTVVGHFQSVIGEEARRQFLDRYGRLPHTVVACIGGGSNAIGIFRAFIGDQNVKLVGVEAGGKGVATGQHGAALSAGRPGALHGAMSYCMQDGDGQILEAHSISAGLDYPGVGPEHAYLKDSRRATYVTVTDTEAIEAFRLLSREEGIIPALESAHAVAGAMRLESLSQDDIVLVNLSGRGDKDLPLLSSLLHDAR